MGVWMTLRRLGQSPQELIKSESLVASASEAIRKQLVILNNYMAAMNNEVDPPDRTEDEHE